MGADETIIYTQVGFVDAVNTLTDGKGADLVFDTVGAAVFKESILATAHFGRLVTLLDPGELSLAEARMRNLLIGFELMLTPMLRDLPEARDKHVSKELPLAEAVEAHQWVEAGHTIGKVVLSV
jgi:NADPH2:quinone reductase